MGSNELFFVAVIHMLKYEPEFLMYGFWMGTIVSVCIGLCFSALSGIFAAINAATTPSSCLAGVRGLYLWNFLACTYQKSRIL